MERRQVVLGAQARGIEILTLNEALESLAEIDARKAHVVELGYFGGLSAEETADVLGIAPVQVKRDWKWAKAWLYGVLSGEQDNPSCNGAPRMAVRCAATADVGRSNGSSLGFRTSVATVR